MGCEYSEAANGWAWPLGNLKQLNVDRLQPTQTAINSSRTCIEHRRIKVYLTRGGHNAIKSTGNSSSLSPTGASDMLITERIEWQRTKETRSKVRGKHALNNDILDKPLESHDDLIYGFFGRCI